jgi:Flp pilus assembly protein TadG
VKGRARELGRDESGASLILVTLCFIVLLGFAAFAVDASAARSQRRENQGAVDTAGLSGIQVTAEKLRAVAVADATNEVVRISYESLFDTPPKPADPTFAEWQAAWASCADSTKPSEYTITGSSDCVSFTAGLQKMRSRLPDIDVDTTFGQVLGRDSIRTGAISVVGVELNGGTGAILPFGLPGSAANDPHVCLKTGPEPQSEDPCDGPASGNFSFLDITQFGFDPNFNTSTLCQGNTNGRLAQNIAEGIDHSLREAPSPGASPWLDRALCNDGNFSSRPYTLTTETGNGKGGALMDGLVNGIAGIDGRLTQAGGPTTNVAGNAIDHRPLWFYLTSSGRSFCENYTGTAFSGAPGDHDLLVSCLREPTHYDAAGNWDEGVIFESTLADAERFAWVPLFFDTTLGNGSTDHNIQDFRPVYLQTTFWKCNAGGCRFIHDPGELPLGGTGGGPGNSSIEALTAIQMPLGALPTSISVDGNPDSAGTLVYSLIE